MPAEFAPHERTVMCWPTRVSLYGDHMADARRAHAAVARTISGYEPVTMIAREPDAAEAASMCGTDVEVVALEIDDSWFRDTGPIYVLDSGRRVATCWRFNGWGGKFVPHDSDATVARRFADSRGDDTREVDVVLEGGSINVDGAGRLLTTEQCLLNPNRNPRLTRSDIEDLLEGHLGASRVVWLPYGLSMDDDTDGHVDNVAAFVAPDTVVTQGATEGADRSRMAANRSVLEAEGLRVLEVPVLPIVEHDGEPVCVPYVNFYLCNGAVIVPVAGHPADDEMLALLAEYVPGRDVVGLDVGAILARGGGGIHCITQQIPAVG